MPNPKGRLLWLLSISALISFGKANAQNNDSVFTNRIDVMSKYPNKKPYPKHNEFISWLRTRYAEFCEKDRNKIFRI
ncbi:MAG: hypothetical protein LBF28_01470 [Rickettsiales bacterium]|nr:hypothetical protein [Rickettsiales bacterium]